MNRDVILIVDDEEAIRTQLKWALSTDYSVLLAGTAEEAIKIVKESKPNLVTLDIALSSAPGGSEEGMELLEKFLSMDPGIKVIMLTGNESRQTALKTIELGAYDYYTKPINIDEIKVIIKRALYIQKIERENRELKGKLEERTKFEEIIGNCPQMHQIFALIRKVATVDVTVLISGESGTGKELVARAIHRESLRKDKPFVPINCGAIPENLLESELFGHEKGAFTDAHISRVGKFEVANGGTIFLDEVGELSPRLQVKILRFLQEREIERVGGRSPIQLDVRIIAATNKDLKEELKRGRFREDLYYRLNVVSINMPPLRERGDDLLLLANSFLRCFCQENNLVIKGFSPAALAAMKQYSWPGNVRELDNKIKRAAIMAKTPFLLPEDLDLVPQSEVRVTNLREAKEQVEKRYVMEALIRCGWNITQAAKEIGVSRVTFHDLMNKYGIRKERLKEDD